MDKIIRTNNVYTALWLAGYLAIVAMMFWT